MRKQYFTNKNRAYKKYKKIDKVYCPYFRKKVRFNSKGFWHIIYRSRNKKREIKSQLLRFKLIPLAVEVINKSHTLQEYEQIKQKRKKVEYFAFIAIVESWKIKVIIKKIGNGKPFFWSIIPNWITNRKRDRVFYKGDLEKD